MDSDIDALYMQFEINYDAILYSAKKASEKGVPIFIDAGAIKRDFPFEALPELEIFSPNESEAYEITGIMPDSDKRCLDVALALSKLVCAKYIVIKLGGRGAYVFAVPFLSRFVSTMNTATATASVITPADTKVNLQSNISARKLAIKGPAKDAEEKHTQILRAWAGMVFSEIIFMRGPRSMDIENPNSAKQSI